MNVDSIEEISDIPQHIRDQRIPETKITQAFCCQTKAQVEIRFYGKEDEVRREQERIEVLQKLIDAGERPEPAAVRPVVFVAPLLEQLTVDDRKEIAIKLMDKKDFKKYSKLQEKKRIVEDKANSAITKVQQLQGEEVDNDQPGSSRSPEDFDRVKLSEKRRREAEAQKRIEAVQAAERKRHPKRKGFLDQSPPATPRRSWIKPKYPYDMKVHIRVFDDTGRLISINGIAVDLKGIPIYEETCDLKGRLLSLNGVSIEKIEGFNGKVMRDERKNLISIAGPPVREEIFDNRGILLFVNGHAIDHKAETIKAAVKMIKTAIESREKKGLVSKLMTIGKPKRKDLKEIIIEQIEKECKEAEFKFKEEEQRAKKLEKHLKDQEKADKKATSQENKTRAKLIEKELGRLEKERVKELDKDTKTKEKELKEMENNLAKEVKDLTKKKPVLVKTYTAAEGKQQNEPEPDSWAYKTYLKRGSMGNDRASEDSEGENEAEVIHVQEVNTNEENIAKNVNEESKKAKKIKDEEEVQEDVEEKYKMEMMKKLQKHQEKMKKIEDGFAKKEKEMASKIVETEHKMKLTELKAKDKDNEKEMKGREKRLKDQVKEKEKETKEKEKETKEKEKIAKEIEKEKKKAEKKEVEIKDKEKKLLEKQMQHNNKEKLENMKELKKQEESQAKVREKEISELKKIEIKAAERELRNQQKLLGKRFQKENKENLSKMKVLQKQEKEETKFREKEIAELEKEAAKEAAKEIERIKKNEKVEEKQSDKEAKERMQRLKEEQKRNEKEVKDREKEIETMEKDRGKRALKDLQHLQKEGRVEEKKLAKEARLKLKKMKEEQNSVEREAKAKAKEITAMEKEQQKLAAKESEGLQKEEKERDKQVKKEMSEKLKGMKAEQERKDNEAKDKLKEIEKIEKDHEKEALKEMDRLKKEGKIFEKRIEKEAKTKLMLLKSTQKIQEEETKKKMKEIEKHENAELKNTAKELQRIKKEGKYRESEVAKETKAKIKKLKEEQKIKDEESKKRENEVAMLEKLEKDILVRQAMMLDDSMKLEKLNEAIEKQKTADSEKERLKQEVIHVINTELDHETKKELKEITEEIDQIEEDKNGIEKEKEKIREVEEAIEMKDEEIQIKTDIIIDDLPDKWKKKINEIRDKCRKKEDEAIKMKEKLASMKDSYTQQINNQVLIEKEVEEVMKKDLDPETSKKVDKFKTKREEILRKIEEAQMNLKKQDERLEDIRKTEDELKEQEDDVINNENNDLKELLDVRMSKDDHEKIVNQLKIDVDILAIDKEGIKEELKQISLKKEVLEKEEQTNATKEKLNSLKVEAGIHKSLLKENEEEIVDLKENIKTENYLKEVDEVKEKEIIAEKVSTEGQVKLQAIAEKRDEIENEKKNMDTDILNCKEEEKVFKENLEEVKKREDETVSKNLSKEAKKVYKKLQKQLKKEQKEIKKKEKELSKAKKMQDKGKVEQKFLKKKEKNIVNKESDKEAKEKLMKIKAEQKEQEKLKKKKEKEESALQEKERKAKKKEKELRDKEEKILEKRLKKEDSEKVKKLKKEQKEKDKETKKLAKEIKALEKAREKEAKKQNKEKNKDKGKGKGKGKSSEKPDNRLSELEQQQFEYHKQNTKLDEELQLLQQKVTKEEEKVEDDEAKAELSSSDIESEDEVEPTVYHNENKESGRVSCSSSTTSVIVPVNNDKDGIPDSKNNGDNDSENESECDSEDEMKDNNEQKDTETEESDTETEKSDKVKYKRSKKEKNSKKKKDKNKNKIKNNKKVKKEQVKEGENKENKELRKEKEKDARIEKTLQKEKEKHENKLQKDMEKQQKKLRKQFEKEQKKQMVLEKKQIKTQMTMGIKNNNIMADMAGVLGKEIIALLNNNNGVNKANLLTDPINLVPNGDNDKGADDVIKELTRNVLLQKLGNFDKENLVLKNEIKILRFALQTCEEKNGTQLEEYGTRIKTAESEITELESYRDNASMLLMQIDALHQQLHFMVTPTEYDKMSQRVKLLNRRILKFKTERDTLKHQKNLLQEEADILKDNVKLEQTHKENEEERTQNHSRMCDNYREKFLNLEKKFDNYTKKAITEQRRILYEYGYKVKDGVFGGDSVLVSDLKDRMIKLELELKDKQHVLNEMGSVERKEEHVESMLKEVAIQMRRMKESNAKFQKEENILHEKIEKHAEKALQNRISEYKSINQAPSRQHYRDSEILHKKIKDLEKREQALNLLVEQKEEIIRTLSSNVSNCYNIHPHSQISNCNDRPQRNCQHCEKGNHLISERMRENLMFPLSHKNPKVQKQLIMNPDAKISPANQKATVFDEFTKNHKKHMFQLKEVERGMHILSKEIKAKFGEQNDRIGAPVVERLAVNVTKMVQELRDNADKIGVKELEKLPIGIPNCCGSQGINYHGNEKSYSFDEIEMLQEEHDQEIKKLKIILEDLKSQNEELILQKVDYEGSVNEVNERLSKDREVRQKMKDAIRFLRKQNKELTKENEELATRNSSQEEIKIVEPTIEKVTLTFDKGIQTKNIKIKENTKDNNKLMEELKSFKNKTEDLRKRNEVLEEYYEKKSKIPGETYELKNKNEELFKQLKALKIDLEKSQKENEDLENNLKEKDEEISNLKKYNTEISPLVETEEDIKYVDSNHSCFTGTCPPDGNAEEENEIPEIIPVKAVEEKVMTTPTNNPKTEHVTITAVKKQKVVSKTVDAVDTPAPSQINKKPSVPEWMRWEEKKEAKVEVEPEEDGNIIEENATHAVKFGRRFRDM